MCFSTMKVGDKAVVKGYCSALAGYRAKLLALGLTRGTTIELKGVAPMGDPIRISVRGYDLSLRRQEAECLILDLPGCEGCSGCGCTKERK